MRIAPDQRAEQRRVAGELARLGFVLPGTLLRRGYRCGKPTCRCTADPPRLHGTFWSWTRKVNGKTVTRRLTDDQQRDYQPWFDNARRLRALVTELETLTLSVVDQDPRWRPAHRPPAKPARGTPNDEGDDRVPPRPVTPTTRPVTKSRDEIAQPPAATVRRCAHCHTPLPPPASTGRPARWCSPACRTRAWRATDHDRHAAATPAPRTSEYRYVTPSSAGTCPTHPGCVIVRCARLLCSNPVHRRNRPGQPRRFCSPACRVAEHRLLRT